MRIAMIGIRGIPARMGGAEHVVEELAREMSARGHDVIVYARPCYLAGDNGHAPPGLVWECASLGSGRTILTAGLEGKHLEAITHASTAMWDVLHRSVDVVHVHSPGPALLSWVPALCGKALVFTVHAPDWRRDKWSRAAKAVLRAGLACGMRLADVVTAVSASLAEGLAREFGREVIHVPNAVRPAQPRPIQAISRWGLATDGYVLHVGRIVPEKRLDLLLRAWPGADAHRPLVVAGDYESSRYGRACRSSAGANVLFLGPRYGQVLAELYTHAALVVQPSVLEGMSLVVLEAAAYGRCILAADIPANREVLGEAAMYFTPDHVTELRQQICRSLANGGLRKRLGTEARSIVEARFSWPATADRMERIYRQARQQKGSGR